MSNKLQKSLSIIAALIMVLGLCACSGTSSSTAPASSAVDSSQEADPYADYPNRTITLIVPYGAGGESDTIARPIAQAMKEFGYTVVVQNIEGASGNIGVMECYNAKPNGYTFMLHMPESMEIYYQSGDLPDHPQKMMKMLGNVVMDSGLLSVAPDSPFQTLDDLITYAKAHPGELTAASTGTMGYNNVSIEMLYDKLGIDVQYVPYENSAKAKAAVLGGHADIYHCYISGGVASVKNGELRALCVGATQRFSEIPDVPTCTELGYDQTWGFHRCFMTTADTHDEICAKMEAAIKAAFESETVKNAYASMGFNSYYESAEELTKDCDEQMPAIGDAYQAMTKTAK